MISLSWAGATKSRKPAALLRLPWLAGQWKVPRLGTSHDVQRISHDPADGAATLAALTQPVISTAGTRTAGMPVTSPRVQALLAALCAFRLLPHGFTNRDLRTHLAPLLGLNPEVMTSGQLSYDLRRLRIHGL